MIIQHNMLALNNLNIGTILQKGKAKNMERLASGYRINRAADDAAGLAISENMTARIRALARCQNNIEEGISLTQTADGALSEVNNMLNRVNELCVQAANGTNTTKDRSKIAEEITQIYDDMDRIFEDTEFNTMKVFRHDGDNYYAPDPEYLYHESVTKLPDGELHNWGAGMFPTKEFDVAKPATAATATLTLGNNVNLNDATTLDGTSFFIKNGTTTYKVEFGQGSSTDSSTIYINTKNHNSVQSAFTAVQNNYSLNRFIDTITVSGNKVNLSFEVPSDSRTFTYTDITTGQPVTAVETIENGAINNNIQIYCGNSLSPIEDTPTAKLVYSQNATQSLEILKGKSNQTSFADFTDLATFRENLKHNGLELVPGGKITFSSADFTTVTTVGDLRSAIATAINNDPNIPSVSAQFDISSDEIIITVSDLSKDVPITNAYIKETTSNVIPTINALDPNNPLISDSFAVSIQTTPATSESFSKHTIQMPSFEKDKIYTLTVKDSVYVIYDYDTYGKYSIKSSPSYIDFSSIYHDMETTFFEILEYEYESDTDYSVTKNNGEITLVSKQLGMNESLIIEQKTPSSFTLDDMSEPVLGIGFQYYDREYSVSLDFSSALNASGGLDTSALNGKGFFLNNTYYQFRDTGNTYEKYNENTKWIDITGRNSIAELSSTIASIIDDPSTDNSITSVVCDTTHITITGQEETTYKSSKNYINFADGAPKGTFTNSAVSSGGSAQKNPQTEIDFSQYDMTNLDELYGTGFRITCATCPGEFINVMFCLDKSELNYPPSFNYTDDDGNNRTIHNYMVELKDITHGSQIAANIAEQLKDDLDHFTEVKVSDTNPSVLIAQDKRSADQSGRAKVMAGVYTNFLYHVDPEKIPNPEDKVGGGRKDTDAYYAYCMIYAGDTTEKPYIAVHLPHFSVENLKLEYPKEPWDSYKEITKVMNRSKTAAEVVSMARSKIGADQNRLEHAFAYAANAEEQITAANSRIKDTDMADAVTVQAKLTILSNAQEAMLSQIVSLPEQILPLLQQ